MRRSCIDDTGAAEPATDIMVNYEAERHHPNQGPLTNITPHQYTWLIIIYEWYLLEEGCTCQLRTTSSSSIDDIIYTLNFAAGGQFAKWVTLTHDSQELLQSVQTENKHVLHHAPTLQCLIARSTLRVGTCLFNHIQDLINA